MPNKASNRKSACSWARYWGEMSIRGNPFGGTPLESNRLVISSGMSGVTFRYRLLAAKVPSRGSLSGTMFPSRSTTTLLLPAQASGIQRQSGMSFTWKSVMPDCVLASLTPKSLAAG